MELADDYPDVVIGRSGGGSKLAGLSFPFLRERLRKGRMVGSSQPSRPPGLPHPRPHRVRLC
jgi:predicted alternative tryptophan synthase beta-subunit